MMKNASKRRSITDSVPVIDIRDLQSAAAEMRKQLDDFYQRYGEASDPDVVPRFRQYSSTDYLFLVNDKRTFGDYVGRHGFKAMGALVRLLGADSVQLSTSDQLCMLVAEALMRQAAGADLALLNAGAIRASIGPGPVSLADVVTALPFDNRVVLISASGAQVEAALRHGLRASASAGRDGGRGGYSAAWRWAASLSR